MLSTSYCFFHDNLNINEMKYLSNMPLSTFTVQSQLGKIEKWFSVGKSRKFNVWDFFLPWKFITEF